MKDSFLSSEKWRRKRENILRRDGYMDQIIFRKEGRMVPADHVHHIFPKEKYPQDAYADWNLISVCRDTHMRRLHNPISGQLTKEGKQLMNETAVLNNIQVTEKILVIGFPGSGKSTYVRQSLGPDAIAYDLDAIAGAFRLRGPHEERHEASRAMANALFKAFALRASDYASRVFLIRTAPTLEELNQIRIDRVVLCKGHHDTSHRSDLRRFDYDFYQQRIENVKKFCEKNAIEFEEIDPPRFDF